MASFLRFMQGFHNSSNTMTDRDHNIPISSQEMQTREMPGETDFAQEAEEDHYDSYEDMHDVSENLIDGTFKESAVDRMDCRSSNHFQNEDTLESVNDRRTPETQPRMQEDRAVTEQGVVQNVERIIRDLEKAVSTGNLERSSAVLSLLVKHQAKLKIQVLSIGSNDNHPFIINVNVETYKIATGPKWKMQVTPSLTIFGLKLKTSLLYGLPLSNQRWIMGNSIPGDRVTLRECDVRDNAEVFLYLTAPQGGDSKEEIALVNGFHKQLMLQGISNEELSFTQAEYNKYLKEAKLRQDSLRMEQTEKRVQPPPGQAPPSWNARQHNYTQPLVESATTRAVLQNPSDTNGLTRSFMGGDFNRSQILAGATSETPQSTPRTGVNFPPPHLVQRGPPISAIQKKRHVLPENQPDRKINQNVFSIPPLRVKKKVSRHHEKRPKTKQVLQRKLIDQPARLHSVGKLADDSRQYGRGMPLRSGDSDHDRVQSLDMDAFRRYGHNGRKESQRLGKTEMVRPTDLDKATPVRRYDDLNSPYNDRGHKIDIPQFQDVNTFPQFNPIDGPQTHRSLARASRRLHRGSPLPAIHFDDKEYEPTRGYHSLPSALDVGWECPSCTLVNPPQIPGCRGCLQDRPEEYKIPDYGSYLMDKDEARHVEELEKNEKKLVEMQLNEEWKQKTMAKQNRIQLYQAAEYNLTTNDEPFECPVCFSEIEPDEGVRLQECLHEICRECLANHINISNEAEVQCPYTDGENDCQQAITDREIRQIVGQAKYDEYKKRSLKSAEAKAANTFHCLTPNCEGFCFYDEEHNFFDCPICRRMSCLTCKVIHEGQNCREYQDDIRIKAVNDETARQTQEELQRLLRQGLAMNCPQCGVVIQKKGGCPNMTCSVCHRGFRWTGVDM